MLFAFQLYCAVFDTQIRVFCVAHREDNKVLINFYFENEPEGEAYSDLLQNLTANSFGVRLVPDSVVNPELIEIKSSMAKLDSDFNFTDSLPPERISYYALLDLDKRSALRNHSYAREGPTKPQSFHAFMLFKNLFVNKFSRADNIWENHKL
jgi:hypothetical protein